MDAGLVEMAFFEKEAVWMGAHVVKPVYTDDAFPDVQTAQNIGTNEPQYHQRGRPLNRMLISYPL